MGSLIKWFVFLLGLVGLGASKKRKEEVKKRGMKQEIVKLEQKERERMRVDKIGGIKRER